MCKAMEDMRNESLQEGKKEENANVLGVSVDDLIYDSVVHARP